ncbi:hypothetical protein Tco_0878959 [Tanacetum coccineum]
MDPNISLGRICMGEQHGVSLNDKVESEGYWNGSEFQDTTNSGEKKIAKAFTFYKMETDEPSDCYITPCFIMRRKMGKNMKKELLVALNGELYFVKFVINSEQDDVEPGVVFGRSFLRLTKGIVDFGNGVITIYPDLEFFGDDSDKSDDSGDE